MLDGGHNLCSGSQFSNSTIGTTWLDSGRNAAQVDLVMEKMGLYAD